MQQFDTGENSDDLGFGVFDRDCRIRCPDGKRAGADPGRGADLSVCAEVFLFKRVSIFPFHKGEKN